MRQTALLLLLSLPVLGVSQLPAYKPTPEELRDSYTRANSLRREYDKAYKLRLEPNWYDQNRRLWYRNEIRGSEEFITVELASGKKAPAFDQARLAEALSKQLDREVKADRLPFDEFEFVDSNKAIRFDVERKGFQCDLSTYSLKEVPAKPRPERRPPGRWEQDTFPGDRRDRPSPDGKWVARISDHNVKVRVKDGTEFALTDMGNEKAYFARIHWSPDSKKLVAVRVTPGDRHQVHLIESSPRDGGRAKLHSRPYNLPGDKLDEFDIWILDPEAVSATKIEMEPLEFFYFGIPDISWRKNGRFVYEKLDRGYGRWRVIEVDPSTGISRTLVDDDPETFFDVGSRFLYRCEDTDELIWRSERDGWGHLYLSDENGVIRNQITKGPWVVRSVMREVDEKGRQIFFQGSGRNPGEDPYFIHFYRVGFDGKGLVDLTPAPGHHTAQFSPDYKYLIDTYSTVLEPPVHELRRVSDGKLIARLESADVSDLPKTWQAPEVFVAKGRDGKTDIWGYVYRPTHLDPGKSYPVIEDIYAGPQDSFVPKNYAPYRGHQALAELGFIVVKIDGMGTRNRGKAFHDVAWKNIADAGFPDRILWMEALAAKYPYIDLARVGVYGTSAGGQNSTGALLFHPDFYKVAVSSCGCHDNRMDKVWWNEQWMGTMGPHYAEQSNITNAGKLKGKLLLMVGEMDRNVPPESTYRLVDALIKANKDFDFLLIPGADHTDGGPYGERKRRDFFVKHLLGVAPPNWNE